MANLPPVVAARTASAVAGSATPTSIRTLVAPSEWSLPLSGVLSTTSPGTSSGALLGPHPGSLAEDRIGEHRRQQSRHNHHDVPGGHPPSPGRLWRQTDVRAALAPLRLVSTSRMSPPSCWNLLAHAKPFG